MSVIMIPELEDEPWPTLGPQVCDFIETYLVFGPGDLRGQPARLSPEKRGLLHRLYEIYPKGHQNEGRRRFRRAAISLRKGTAKTEFAAWIAACELHHEGPVRCDGFDAGGNPVGRPVNDPYIPLMAYTEEQSEELAYAALLTILSLSPLADDFDIGLERIMRAGGGGKAVALATAPDARDGARTTFQHFDETHRLHLPRLKRAHQTMLANLPKRLMADPWCLETTTTFSPGQNSVAEDTMAYATAIARGETQDARLFFFHRQAGDGHDLTTIEGRTAAVVEASGGDAEWSDVPAIVGQWDDPRADTAYLERTWLNRPVQAAAQFFNVARLRELANPHPVPAGELITIGFDGARYHDSTALWGTHVETGYQWRIGLWEKPDYADDWEVPARLVDAAVTEAFKTWNVWRMYADPYWWESWIAEWQGRWGDRRVIAWKTNRIRPMAYALKAFQNAILAGELTNDGDEDFMRHMGNACRQETSFTDSDGRPLCLIHKERPDSSKRMDIAMAVVLSAEARRDAVADGAMNAPGPSKYETEGMLVL